MANDLIYYDFFSHVIVQQYNSKVKLIDTKNEVVKPEKTSGIYLKQYIEEMNEIISLIKQYKTLVEKDCGEMTKQIDTTFEQDIQNILSIFK